MNRTSSLVDRLKLSSLASLLGVVVALGATACSSNTTAGGGTPVDVSGSYTGNVTNGASTCPGNWQAGATATVAMNAVQSGGDVSLDVTGAAEAFLDVALGSSTFEGTVSGDDISATLRGTTSATDGNCTYTWSAAFAGALSGNTLTGTITFTPVTNNGSDCTAHQIQNCSEVESFDGVRPSTPPTGADGGTTADAG